MKFKTFLLNLKEWFISSNRWKHLLAGCLVFLTTFLIYGVFVEFSGLAILGSYISTLVAMLTAEFKDVSYKGKWDWKDINAGLLCGHTAFIVWLCTIII